VSGLAITLAALALSTPGANDDPGAIVDAIGEAADATTQPLDGATMAFLSDGDATAGWYGAQSDNLSHIRGTTVAAATTPSSSRCASRSPRRRTA
jgi:hypothetical protein